MNEHEARVEVVNEHGLHARPATQFTQLANRFDAEIEVLKGEMAVDGKSVVSMLTLGAPCGTRLLIRARGADAARAVQELAELIASGFPNITKQEDGPDRREQCDPEE